MQVMFANINVFEVKENLESHSFQRNLYLTNVFLVLFFRAERPKNHVCDVENCGKGNS